MTRRKERRLRRQANKIRRNTTKNMRALVRWIVGFERAYQIPGTATMVFEIDSEE